MAYVTGGTVADLGYQVHHLARTFGRFPWELERAVESGEVNIREVFRAMAFESADARGKRKAQELAQKKARRARRAS